jgi:protein-tyrosine kinase
MEEIREAIERAKAGDAFASARHERRAAPQVRVASKPGPFPAAGSHAPESRFDPAQEFELDAAHLQSKRIIAHNFMDAQAVAFDMLRTQVLQSMDPKEWRVLGITSPSPGCGKTVTAVNLALSIGRHPEKNVFLMDLDLRKPQVANVLGLRPRDGIMSVLENRSSLTDAIMQTRVGDSRMMVLPAESRASRPSDWMASSSMSGVLQKIKQDYQSSIIIVDLPPLLSSDDVLAILPRLDCVLLVTAVGTTTIAEIKESSNHLQSTELVRIVLNKVSRSKSAYYYYS